VVLYDIGTVFVVSMKISRLSKMCSNENYSKFRIGDYLSDIPLLEESNGKLPLRICPGHSVPVPYQLPDWALVSAPTGPRAEYV
jgi:hypothetical protein